MTIYLQDDFETAGDTSFHGRTPPIGWSGHTWIGQSSDANTHVTGGRVIRNPSNGTLYAGYGDTATETPIDPSFKDVVLELQVQFPDASATEAVGSWIASIYFAGTPYYSVEIRFLAPTGGTPQYTQCRINVYTSGGTLADTTVSIDPISPLSVHDVRLEITDNLQAVYVDDTLVHSTTANISARGGLSLFDLVSNNLGFTDPDELNPWDELQLLFVQIGSDASGPLPSEFWTVFRGRSHEEI